MTIVHRGRAVAAGVALGRVRFVGYGDADSFPLRVPADQVEEELNRLREALDLGRTQIEELKSRHGDTLGESEVRIFDVHLAYLSDPMFIDQIEKLVLEERYSIRAAIQKVVADYDRIFELVEDERLRQRAGDLRDVGTRLSRNVEGVRDDAPRPEQGATAVQVEERGGTRVVLVAKRLTVNDLFGYDGQVRVEGIVAEDGGISSHASILARSLGIPALTGVADLSSKVQEGDFVVVDAAAGELIVDPDERLRAEYEESSERTRGMAAIDVPTEAEAMMRCGTRLSLLGACGSVAEVGMARTFGMSGIGVFRTELMFFIEKDRLPSEERLAHHYAEVCRGPQDEPCAFRLLDVSPFHEVSGTPDVSERNPALGLRGVRLLLHDSRVLRLQIRALLRATAGASKAALLVPFVTGVGDLQRVKAAVLEERLRLKREGVATAPHLDIAPLIEVPAAAFVVEAFLHESDYVVVSIDDLQALLLAAGRDNSHVREYHDSMHPALFELIARVARAAKAADKPLVLFGEGAADPVRLPFYLGVGIRNFAVAPARVREIVQTARRFTANECVKIAEDVLEKPRALDVQRVLVPLSEQE